jgi:hypothetical protein
MVRPVRPWEGGVGHIWPLDISHGRPCHSVICQQAPLLPPGLQPSSLTLTSFGYEWTLQWNAVVTAQHIATGREYKVGSFEGFVYNRHRSYWVGDFGCTGVSNTWLPAALGQLVFGSIPACHNLGSPLGTPHMLALQNNPPKACIRPHNLGRHFKPHLIFLGSRHAVHAMHCRASLGGLGVCAVASRARPR